MRHYVPRMRRAAALAGLWYPGDATSCREAIEAHVRDAPEAAEDVRGLVGPHAGWAYSGDCAGKAYGALAARRGDVELAVVFGSHRGPNGPHTIFRGHAWETPLGPIETDRELADRLASELGLADEPAAPLRADNGVELHLPFVRWAFPRARLLMIGPGASPFAIRIGRRVGELVRAARRDAVFLGSTDLTHYGPSYGFSPAGSGARAVQWVREDNDAVFLDALLAADARGVLERGLERQSACCPGAVAATLEALRAYGHTPEPVLVDHVLSCDVRPASSFVGYASVLL